MLNLKDLIAPPPPPDLKLPVFCTLRYRGHRIDCGELNGRGQLYVDGQRIAVTKLGDGAYHSWLVPQRWFNSLAMLGKGYIDLYFGLSGPLAIDGPRVGHFELPEPE